MEAEMRNETHWFSSTGSHQKITDAFLGYLKDVFWSSGPPSLQNGVFAPVWTLEHVIALNTVGINGPIRIAVLETKNGKAKARILDDPELAQHKQNVAEAKDHLRIRAPGQPADAVQASAWSHIILLRKTTP